MNLKDMNIKTKFWLMTFLLIFLMALFFVYGFVSDIWDKDFKELPWYDSAFSSSLILLLLYLASKYIKVATKYEEACKRKH